MIPCCFLTLMVLRVYIMGYYTTIHNLVPWTILHVLREASREDQYDKAILEHYDKMIELDRAKNSAIY